MLEKSRADTILEVGCNRGHNLLALRYLFPDADIRGVEPQPYARRLAQRAGLDVRPGTIYQIPYPADSFDLVLVCGVLIHVPPRKLDVALSETLRVTRRRLLSIEYWDGVEETPRYRGLDEMLWKRDVGAHVRDLEGQDGVVGVAGATIAVSASGPAAEGFAAAWYWLFEKWSADRSG